MDGVKLRKTMVSTVFVILIAFVKQLNIIYMVDTKHVTVACVLGHPVYGTYSGHSAVRADKSPDNLTLYNSAGSTFHFGEFKLLQVFSNS